MKILIAFFTCFRLLPVCFQLLLSFSTCFQLLPLLPKRLNYVRTMHVIPRYGVCVMTIVGLQVSTGAALPRKQTLSCSKDQVLLGAPCPVLLAPCAAFPVCTFQGWDLTVELAVWHSRIAYAEPTPLQFCWGTEFSRTALLKTS